MASPDYGVSRRGGYVGPHRHLEDQTDHLLFFCHLSSPVAKHCSHASWSLRRPCRICYSAPNICSALPELSAMGWSDHAVGRDWLGFRPLCNHLKIPVMVECATFSGCNNFRSRASRPDTNRSWG